MLITMGVSLYTSRIVLATLGVEDYGIYGVVGGVVVLFSFLNRAMSSATQRFLNFELGRNDLVEVRRVFSMSITVHISIALVIAALAETVGLWFLNTQMEIPDEKMNVANWVYQITILTACIGIIQTPYNASIIAYEKMSFYAYLGILDVIFKLSIVFLLVHIHYEKLKIYAALLLTAGIIMFFICKLYCSKTLPSSRYIFFWDKDLFKGLINFSGWSLFGAVANVGKSQGINILINIFYGVTVNAAFAISNQVVNALNGFVGSFQTAFNPQIVKLYAKEDRESLLNLIFRTSRYSFFLLFILSLPVLLHTNIILHTWLKIVPEYSVEFTQSVIIYMLLESISGPLWVAVYASGKIKKYQIVIGSLLLFNIPISYILLKLNFLPYYVFAAMFVLGIFALLARILFLRSIIQLPSKLFFKNVIVKIIIMSVIAFLSAYSINKLFPDNLYGIIVSVISTVAVSALSIYFVGIDKNEKLVLIGYIKRKLKWCN
jgi:O-antigen/teichoic acid export membrane protein